MEILAPNAERVADFWLTASRAIRLSGDDPVLGANDQGLLTPGAWSFGRTPQEADGLLALVLSGTKTATSSSLPEYQEAGEELPTEGQMSIICDSHGTPRALVRNTRVRVMEFDEIDAEVARAEGEGDLSLRYWQEEHEAFFGGRPQVVVEEFTLIYPKK